jgi:cytochrome c biogenesis protein CcdA
LSLDNPGPGKITLVFSLSMALIFLGLGYFFIFTNIWIESYPRPSRTYIGLILCLWAVFRGISVWLKYKRMNEENED